MSRILCVSQNSDVRAAVSRVLSRAGWEVMTAAHAGHASLACVAAPPFDVLVVADEEAPGADGGALAVRLRRYCPELRVVRMRTNPFAADELIEAVLRAACALAVA
ncbi:MAG TPA: hypothetical protein VMZ90_07810 [Vicinamibacterales bacterium]|nr:hypothetical protein [Vicinamibacterales bacterium]